MIHFAPQCGEAGRGQAIQLLVARGVRGFRMIDPTVLEQPPERPIHGPGAQANPAVAQRLDVLHESVAMAGLLGEAEEDPEDRFAERFDPLGVAAADAVASLDDVSHGDILGEPDSHVNGMTGGFQTYRGGDALKR